MGFPILDLVRLIIRAIVPGLFAYVPTMVGFVVVMALVHSMYARVSAMELRMLGIQRYPAMLRTARALGAGTIGGLVGSLVFILLGASVSHMGIGFIWLLAIGMAMVDLRFMCFAYAGGIISLSRIIFGWPVVEVPAIMALVGVLHLVESALIWTTAHWDASPVLIEGPNGEIRGGFLIQKFWPVPIVVGALVFVALAQMPQGIVAMPEWWPLIKSSAIAPEGTQAVFAVLAITAGLGYGDMTYTRLPEEKARYTAVLSALYSVLLIGLAVMCSYVPRTAVVAALFAPLGHESLIYLARLTERRRKPMFIHPEEGIMVLDVIPGSPAQQAGMRRGDIVLSVNGVPVSSTSDFARGLDVLSYAVVMDVRPSISTEPILRTVQIRGRHSKLGLVFVPEGPGVPTVKQAQGGLFSAITRWIRAKRRRI